MKYCHPYHQISAKNFFFVILIKDIPRPHEKYTNNVGNKSQTHFSVSLTHSVSDEVEGKIVNIFFNFRRREKESQNYSAMFTKSPSEIPVKWIEEGICIIGQVTGITGTILERLLVRVSSLITHLSLLLLIFFFGNFQIFSIRVFLSIFFSLFIMVYEVISQLNATQPLLFKFLLSVPHKNSNESDEKIFSFNFAKTRSRVAN